MKMRRIAGLLLTAACAVSLLCPAAWAVNASSVDKSGGNVRLSYRLQMPAVEDSAKIGADVKAQVKTTARRTSNSVVEIDMNSRADAESQLGMKFVSSSTFDALPQGGGTDNVVVSFKPSQKITNTMYNQYRTDGAVSLTFAASTRWDGSDEAAVEESVTAPGASYAKADYTAANGQVYQIYSVKDAAGNVRGIHLFGEVTLTFPALIEIVIILLAAFLSFKTTDKQIRIRNHFTWGAIKEVAVLFIGIFITMQPALMLLKAVGPNLGVTEPAEMFWATGALSSFLDNTPTYLVFLTTAGTLAFTNGITTTLGTVPTKILSAISCGAVFMGANTYIGNAPNFMVKAISDENGVKMPSFFGYMLWSVAFLIPVFVIDMFVFFL